MVWPFGPSASFQTIVSAKREQRDDAIQAQVTALHAGDRLTAEDVSVVSKTGKSFPAGSRMQFSSCPPGLEIVKSIQDREFTSTHILKAFIKSAILAQKETNCLTEGEEWSYDQLDTCPF